MPLLTDFRWKTKYDLDDGSLVEQFYLAALACAQRYDRTTGYFSATALANADACAWSWAARWGNRRWTRSGRGSR